MDLNMTSKLSRETEIAQAYGGHNLDTGAIMPSIHPSTTFARDDEYNLIAEQFSYGRDENPTNKIPEDMLAAESLNLMEEREITSLLVSDERNRLKGILTLNELINFATEAKKKQSL